MDFVRPVEAVVLAQAAAPLNLRTVARLPSRTPRLTDSTARYPQIAVR